MKLTWAKTDDILDSIPFKVTENFLSQPNMQFVLWSEHELGAEEVILKICSSEFSLLVLFT